MGGFIARIVGLLGKGTKYAGKFAKALKGTKIASVMRTYGGKAVQWLVTPFTKFGAKLSSKIAGRFVVAGRKCTALAAKYPKLAKPLNALGRVLTNHGNAKLIGDVLVSLVGIEALDIVMRAIIGNPDGEEAHKYARELGFDLSNDEDRLAFLAIVENLADNGEYIKYISGQSIYLKDQGATSPDFAIEASDFSRAVAAYVFGGGAGQIENYLKRLSPVGFLQITGRLASLATIATGSHASEKAVKLSRVRLFLLTNSGVALHDGVNRICEFILNSQDETVNDALDMVDGAILANAQGVSDFFVDTIDGEFNSVWDNIKGFFTTDNYEAKKIREQFESDENRVVAHCFAILSSVVPAGEGLVGELSSSDDEEIRFTADAIAGIALDVDGSGDTDEHDLSTKSKLFARACLTGSGTVLHDALYDE